MAAKKAKTDEKAAPKGASATTTQADKEAERKALENDTGGVDASERQSAGGAGVVQAPPGVAGPDAVAGEARTRVIPPAEAVRVTTIPREPVNGEPDASDRQSAGGAGTYQAPPPVTEPATAAASRPASVLAAKTSASMSVDGPIIRISAKRDGFRRGGMAHSATAQTYPVSRFSPHQLDAILSEPMLVTQILGDD